MANELTLLGCGLSGLGDFVLTDVQTLTGDVVITSSSSHSFYDTGGVDRSATLPAVRKGSFWIATNTGSLGVISVYAPNGSFVSDVYPGETSKFDCDGTTWRVE